MPSWLHTVIKLIGVFIGLIVIYLILNQVVNYAKINVQTSQNETISAYVKNSYLSLEPFGVPTQVVSPGSQVFYNMEVTKTDGIVCFITVTWRWTRHISTGTIVYWTDASGGETATGSQYTPKVSQAFTVPTNLSTGLYTLSRLSTYKCGSDDIYAKVIRTTEVLVTGAS